MNIIQENKVQRKRIDAKTFKFIC